MFLGLALPMALPIQHTLLMAQMGKELGKDANSPEGGRSQVGIQQSRLGGLSGRPSVEP